MWFTFLNHKVGSFYYRPGNVLHTVYCEAQQVERCFIILHFIVSLYTIHRMYFK